ncbi:hypothetical protein JCM8547_008512 [Rhodosporidiobolus lusitaniae]
MASYAPFIMSPPLTTCQDAYLVFGQGTPPYIINVLATGQNTTASLEQLPIQKKAGYVKWRVDFNEGANVTFAVSDNTGTTAYSQYRVVQADLQNNVTTCSKTVYSDPSSTNAGAIAGGVVGGLALLAIVLALLWWRRRQLHRQAGFFSSGRKSPSDEDDDMRLANGPAGVFRAGTFNLGNVRFTEASLDHLRAIDRPPGYGETVVEVAEGEVVPVATVDGHEEASASAVETPGAMSTGEAGQPRLAPPVPQQRRNRVREAQERRDRELAERLAREDDEEAVRVQAGVAVEGRRSIDGV